MSQPSRNRWEGSDSDEDDSGKPAASSSLPTSPPFYVYLSPVKPDAFEETIYEFFNELTIKAVGTSGGVARVEFEDRESLARALFYNGRVLQGSVARVELSPPPIQSSPAAPGPKVAAKSPREASNSQRTRRGQTTERAGGGRGGFRDSWGEPRESRYGDRDRDRAAGGPRGRGGFSGDRDGVPSRGPQSQSNREETSAGGGVPPQTKESTEEPRGDSTPEGGAQQRPQYRRLQLKPRSKPIGAAPEAPPERNVSIFGGGKPHDEVEYVRKKGTADGDVKETPEKGTSAQASGSSGSRSAQGHSGSPSKTRERAGSFGRKESNQDRSFTNRGRSGSWDREKPLPNPNTKKNTEKKDKPPRTVEDENGWVIEKPVPSRRKSETKGEAIKGEEAPRSHVQNAFSALNLEDSEGED